MLKVDWSNVGLSVVFAFYWHSGRDFIAPCKCKGTSKYVHRECLDHWRAVKVWVPSMSLLLLLFDSWWIASYWVFLPCRTTLLLNALTVVGWGINQRRRPNQMARQCIQHQCVSTWFRMQALVVFFRKESLVSAISYMIFCCYAKMAYEDVLVNSLNLLLTGI